MAKMSDGFPGTSKHNQNNTHKFRNVHIVDYPCHIYYLNPNVVTGAPI